MHVACQQLLALLIIFS